MRIGAWNTLELQCRSDAFDLLGATCNAGAIFLGALDA